jgi:hypothetical protein
MGAGCWRVCWQDVLSSREANKPRAASSRREKGGRREFMVLRWAG